MSSFIISFSKIFLIDVILDILYFPVWWYSKGLKNVLLWAGRRIRIANINLSLRLWLTSLFKPMFGERSRSGRIISFFMRLMVLVWRSFLILMVILSASLVIVIWIVLPVFIVYQIVILSTGQEFGVINIRSFSIYYPR